MNIETDKEKADFGLVTQSVQESIGLNKNTWGYFRLDVSSDAPFLWIERPIVTPEDFIAAATSCAIWWTRRGCILETIRTDSEFGRYLEHRH